MGYRICEETSRIIMTRGDTVKISVGVKFKESGEPYEPEADDTIRFSVKKYLSDKNPVIVKDVPIETMLLVLDPDDTKSLSFGEYHYDVQLIKKNGDTDTIIPDKILELTGEVY